MLSQCFSVCVYNTFSPLPYGLDSSPSRRKHTGRDSKAGMVVATREGRAHAQHKLRLKGLKGLCSRRMEKKEETWEKESFLTAPIPMCLWEQQVSPWCSHSLPCTRWATNRNLNVFLHWEAASNPYWSHNLCLIEVHLQKILWKWFHHFHLAPSPSKLISFAMTCGHEVYILPTVPLTQKSGTNTKTNSKIGTGCNPWNGL